AIGRAAHAHRPYWIPMTIAIVLKPDFGSTISRGVLRLCGTFAGLVIATGLFHILPRGNASEIATLAVLMFLTRCFGSANYGLFTLTVTGLLVYLIALTGVPPKDAILARGLNTFAGGTIALAAYWLWPTWER